MSINDGNQRLRDPFYVSPLPRTYYHPSPSRDVDINVAIQSPGKGDQSSNRRDVEDPFDLGSTFKLSALPQLKSAIRQSQMSQGSDDMVDIHSRIEQPSNSTLLDSTHLTSSIDEKDKTASMEFALSHQREERQGESISTIQRYIDRFRYSVPKSREEREKEKAQKQNTLWWLNSDIPPRNGLEKPHAKKSSERLPPTEHIQLSKPKSQLTREAILELDKETSDLQLKAEKILSKSQLSLASSGPCVSTDGLGSSTTLSECSYKTDQQPPYRPIFVNLQGNLGEYQKGPVIPKQKFQKIEEEHPLSPQDALARWRMRRKMGDAQQRINMKASTAHKPTRNNSEMDARLEEFRKKLFAQRTLITSEDIQFERQKMKMIIDDAENQEEPKSHKIEISRTKDELKPSNSVLAEDPILLRLKEITKTNETPYFGKSLSTDHGSDSSFLQKAQTKQTHVSPAHPESEISFNSNNVNLPQDTNDFNTTPSELPSLNRNNTALSQRRFDSQEMESYHIDDMKSMHTCDAQQRVFHLNPNAISINGGLSMVDRDVTENSGDNENYLDNNQRVELRANLNREKSSHKNEHVCDQNTQYHQRLEAEKPCGESNKCRERLHKQDFKKQQNSNNKNASKSDISYESDNSVSSRKSERNKHLHKDKKIKQKTHESDNIRYSNEEEMSDSSSKKSDSSTVKATQSSRNVNIQINDTSSERVNLNDKAVKLKAVDKEKKDQASTQVSPPLRKEAPAPRQIENINISVSQSSQHNNIHRAIGEAVVDHLFDGPSMISSVDSWASLFPQSPSRSHSLYNSTVVTPTKDVSSNHQTMNSSLSPSQHLPATPPNKQIITSTPHSDKINSSSYSENEIGDSTENEDGNKDSCEEFESDPLMNLLLQQKKEYLRKLELIEFKLQQLEEDPS